VPYAYVKGHQNLFKRIRSIEMYKVFEDEAEKPNSVTYTCAISETTVAAETACKHG
jgi:hypothetical protein